MFRQKGEGKKKEKTSPVSGLEPKKFCLHRPPSFFPGVPFLLSSGYVEGNAAYVHNVAACIVWGYATTV